ncbi:isocitrate lyase/PEP mutase family protein [Sphingobium sp. JS3065]|jgi:methylisocitrate lyase|uniref:isocitrate lyase/PEP mutase family protein n=1 Tax=Sphingobium sp. JS3065 TaxID=2970925 RepID=UPI002264EB76|nr:isocitrate lyase/PEP mutase family protein [Sphingobium sp. JS3065]UZW57245.1 isocitrate lyase/PEP mutase family protein [Sphingobium sp. JS3065]
MSNRKTTRLKALFQRPETVLMPFGTLPIHAQMAERAGFEAFEISGSMTAWWTMGMPDLGLVTLTEMVQHATRVARSVDIPVYCDADTGYGGGPANIRRTVHEFAHAGIAGVHIEDQQEPKKAGGQSGIAIVSDAEAIGRLNAATDARDEIDKDFVIVARTDGYGAAGGGLDEAIRRGQLYCAETDADVIFYEGLHTWEQIETAIAATPRPAYAIPSVKIGRRPTLAELSAMGQSIDIVPFILAGVQEPWKLLVDIKSSGEYGPMDEYYEKLNSYRGTPYDMGWGEVFARPTYREVRDWEEKYLPAQLHRDYVNNVNSED